MLVYHGMTAADVEEVMRVGLHRGKRWHGIPPSVYFTKKIEDSHYYGILAGSSTGAYAIVEFEIPDDLEIIYDYHDNELGFTDSYRVERDVPASWNKDIKIYGTGYEELSARLKRLKMVDAEKRLTDLRRLIGEHNFNL